MKEITNIAKTFFAYLIRPQLYPELFRKIYKNIFQRQAAFKGKDRSEQWCEELAISQDKAIKEVLNFKDYQSINMLYADVLAKSEQIEKDCPIKMGGAGALDLIFYLNEYVSSKNSLETGVAYGWSSLAALLSLEKRNGTLYSSDMPYLSQNGDKYVGCIVPESLKSNWKLFRFADKESLPKIFMEQSDFDFMHYDSDKSYNGRMWAYPVLWERLRKGGILMSDDVSDNAAFMDYCQQNNLRPTIVGFDNKYAAFVIK